MKVSKKLSHLKVMIQKVSRSNLLEKIKVLDLSLRLPGPLASYYLASYGAQVNRFILKEDPFEKHPHEAVFRNWFKALSKNKTVISNHKDLQKNWDIIITPDKKIFHDFIKENKLISKAIISIAGKKDGSALHDINAFSEYFSIEKLPVLPMAGILLSKEIKSLSLAALISYSGKTIEETVYLDHTLKELQILLGSHKENEVLHTGKFPCYNIFVLKTGEKVAFAPIEEHFWREFLKISKISLLCDDRFDTTGKVKESIKDYFNKLSLNEFNNRYANQNICISLMK